MTHEIFSKVQVGDESTCWIFQGSIVNGYGRWRRQFAHRVVYAELVGPLAKGTVLHHTCGNKACCNPAHLEALTPREHYLRHPHPMKREVAHCKRGHEFTEENTYLFRGRRNCRACGRERNARSKARKR